MADNEITIKVTEDELDLIRRALGEHEIKRNGKGLSTEDLKKLEKKLDAAK
jgi:hypothetical protein